VSVSEPPRTSPLAWLQLRLASRLTRVVLGWSILAGAIVGVSFGAVAARQKASLAYDLLTLHQSPIGSRAGVPGVVLGSLGYLLVPAVIGALVSAGFTKSMRITRAQYEQGVADLANDVQRRLTPPATVHEHKH